VEGSLHVPKTSSIRPVVSFQYQLVSVADGQTDGRTHDDSIYRTSIASRGNKTWLSKHATICIGLVKQTSTASITVDVDNSSRISSIRQMAPLWTPLAGNYRIALIYLYSLRRRDVTCPAAVAAANRLLEAIYCSLQRIWSPLSKAALFYASDLQFKIGLCEFQFLILASFESVKMYNFMPSAHLTWHKIK